MFYVNNKQVLGMFLNGKNLNYLAYGFGKIIPENRNAQLAYINLAGRNLSQYRVKYGNIQSGYNNFPIARLDYPVKGVFHSPLTYYYGGNIVPTKNVPVYINNGYCAIRGPVYNDININGNIVYFATNSDFQGHNVNTYLEGSDSSQSYFNGIVMNNCSNFHLKSLSRFSKGSQAALYNCRNFSGWFNYVRGDDGTRYPGFRGFLYECKDGVFNIDCTNMRGGGSDANVRNYYNFSGIQNCKNINVNIKGSSWQAWVHPNCYSDNCNITTRYIVPGFDHMNHCNFNIYLPSNANVEKSTHYSLLSNSYNCNYNLNASGSNLYNYKGVAFFDNLNNCNLNLLVNNAVKFSDGFGGHFNNCNIVFDNIKGDLLTQNGWYNLYNCRITGNVKSASSTQGFLEHSYNLNVNLNFAESSRVLFASRCNNIKGNIVAGNMTYVNSSSYMSLNVNNGNLSLNNIDYGSFNVYNAIAQFRNVNNSNARSKSRAYISAIDNCHNISLYDLNIVGGTLIENVYDSSLNFNYGPVGRMFTTRRVNNCSITGFPTTTAYTSNCKFDVSLEEAESRSSYITWANVWPHGSRAYSGSYGYLAGLSSVDGLISHCFMSGDDMILGGSITFDNVINVETSIDTYYNGTATANLKNYADNIRLNVDCATLKLGVFMSGPPHGFAYSSISANDIYCTTGKDYYVHMNYGTRVYCENFCNVPFTPVWRRFSDNYQPVLLINNYKHSNSGACIFKGGLTRIGSLNYQGGATVPLELYNGACMFINNARLGTTTVDNALLFLGTNVHFEGAKTVKNGGLIVSKANYSMNAIGKFVNRNNFTWNFKDSGPWGSKSLLDFCTNV
ncbi:MAG: hypothetical protein UHK60_06950 [Acutalibacteraceae bacterium]|nr:hypothetical protein [Acutalibacteraceae bacterium]